MAKERAKEGHDGRSHHVADMREHARESHASRPEHDPAKEGDNGGLPTTYFENSRDVDTEK